jgi:hypothetical protein
MQVVVRTSHLGCDSTGDELGGKVAVLIPPPAEGNANHGTAMRKV